MDYMEAVNYIHGTLKFGSKLGLHNIRLLLEYMGNPQDKLRFVHIAGTNGKGSTAAFTSSILRESGLRTGLFTSPFLQRFTERIRVDNEEIGEKDLARITGFVRDKVIRMLDAGENHPTEFELITAIAFQYFMEKACDVVVLEVGLGGRFDSTNVIRVPDLAVITTISYDHIDRLGNTLGEIAFEKAGIIKPGGNILLYPQHPEAEAVFEKACAERDARLHKVDFASLSLNHCGIDGQNFDYKSYKGLEISLLGEHQLKNASLALEAAGLLSSCGFPITEDSIRRGLTMARWPGRLEVLSREPVFLIDGAHNPEGAQVLRNMLDTYFPGRSITFIVGVLRDKDYKTMLEKVLPGCGRVIAITPESDRALPAAELAAVVRNYCKNVLISDTIENAADESMKQAAVDDVICAFGSLYYIGKLREIYGASS